MRHLTIGILAHVDAGKTTLSEALLYTAGAIRKQGRVDHGDAFLDTDLQEKQRGITIYSKQAVFRSGDTEITLLDTPGHVDFSAETERTLQVLDAAVLVVSGADGVQSHTRTLWNLLRTYRVPVFVFVNKMDQPGVKKERVMEQLRNVLKAGFVEFSSVPAGTFALPGAGGAAGAKGTSGAGEGAGIPGRPADFSDPDFQEELAVLDEDLMERYLEEGGEIADGDIVRLIRERKLFPVSFGSALRLAGVEAFLGLLDRFAPAPAPEEYPAEFGARVFKITRDEQGNRLTWMKITGGALKVKMTLSEGDSDSAGGAPGTDEKIDQIRQYSGARFTPLKEAAAGMIAAVTGPEHTRAGQGLGFEENGRMPLLSPVLTYRLLLPDGVDAAAMLPKMRSLEEEEPELHVLWDERTKEIRVQLMGAVQTEVLKELAERRYGVRLSFDEGSIAYKETIASPVEGVSHFEPLRHYAEVHLLMEPGEPGSGLQFASDISVDRLALNWQRLILTHLEEREHPGVLTGSPITDMKITVAAGRAHDKHTEGGDFRQATYRAVRNGLMFAENVLLEPWYRFTLAVPAAAVGRAMTDLDRMGAQFALGAGAEEAAGDETGFGGADSGDSGLTVLSGKVPVSEIRNYADQVRAYTKGEGTLSVRLLGYFPCHNAEEVIEASGYDPELDPENPPDSVFCSHGVGTIIPWYDVPEYMHLPPVLEETGWDGDDAPGAAGLSPDEALSEEEEARLRAASFRGRRSAGGAAEGPFLSVEEVDAILDRAGSANRRASGQKRRMGQRRRYKETLDYGADLYGEAASPAAARAKAEQKTSEKSAEALRKAESVSGMDRRKEFFLVDGYNIIFAWPELRSLAEKNIDSARLALQDRLSDYQGYRGSVLIVAFDAYRVAGHQVEIFDYHNIHVVFTKEAQTADAYIEQFTHEHAKTDRVVVATSDGLEQVIVRSAGSELMSANDLKEDLERRTSAARETHLKRSAPRDTTLAEKLAALKGNGKDGRAGQH